MFNKRLVQRRFSEQGQKLTFINNLKSFKIMQTKVKVARSFTFKAYIAESEEALTNVKERKFLSKSECHYYCEKFVLDYVKNNMSSVENKVFAIFKVSTLEDVECEDLLIELITVKDDKINIR